MRGFRRKDARSFDASVISLGRKERAQWKRLFIYVSLQFQVKESSENVKFDDAGRMWPVFEISFVHTAIIDLLQKAIRDK